MRELMKSAAAGNPKAQHNLARIYLGLSPAAIDGGGWTGLSGELPGRDPREARRWLEAAAGAGHAASSFLLAELLSGAFGDVPPDMPAAAEHLLDAARTLAATVFLYS